MKRLTSEGSSGRMPGEGCSDQKLGRVRSRALPMKRYRRASLLRAHEYGGTGLAHRCQWQPAGQTRNGGCARKLSRSANESQREHAMMT